MWTKQNDSLISCKLKEIYGIVWNDVISAALSGVWKCKFWKMWFFFWSAIVWCCSELWASDHEIISWFGTLFALWVWHWQQRKYSPFFKVSQNQLNSPKILLSQIKHTMMGSHTKYSHNTHFTLMQSSRSSRTFLSR